MGRKSLQFCEYCSVKCKDCKVKYQSKFCINLHRNKHIITCSGKEKKFKCNICLKKFANVANFLLHKTFHDQNKRRKLSFNVVQSSVPQMKEKIKDAEVQKSSRRKQTPRRFEPRKSLTTTERTANNGCLGLPKPNSQSPWPQDASIQRSPNSWTTQNESGNANPYVSKDVSSQRAGKFNTGDAGYWAVNPGTTLHYISSASNVEVSSPVDQNHANQQFFEYESVPEGQSNCPICNAHFTKRWNLLRHYRAHGDTRPFKCSICGRFFKETGHLNQHMITHRNNKPYECEICDASYTRNESLKNHKHKFHGIALENVGIHGFERGQISENKAFSVTKEVCSAEKNSDPNLLTAKEQNFEVAVIGSKSSKHSRNSHFPDNQEFYDGYSDMSSYSDNFPDSETDTADENENEIAAEGEIVVEKTDDSYNIKTTAPCMKNVECSTLNDHFKRNQKLHCNRSSYFDSISPREAATYEQICGPVQSHRIPNVDRLQADTNISPREAATYEQIYGPVQSNRIPTVDRFQADTNISPREAATYEQIYGPVQSHRIPTVDRLQADTNAERFQCQFCENKFQSESWMGEHISKEHPNETFQTSHITYRCPICALKCEDEKYLFSHFTRAHPAANFKLACKFCGIFFTNEADYHQHAELHGKRSTQFNEYVDSLKPGNSVREKLSNGVEMKHGELNETFSPRISDSNTFSQGFPTVSAVFQAESLEHPRPLQKIPQHLINAECLESSSCEIQRDHQELDYGNEEPDACHVVSPCRSQDDTSLKTSFTTTENNVKSASPNGNVFTEDNSTIMILNRNNEGLQSVTELNGYYCTVCNKMQENRVHFCSADNTKSKTSEELNRQWQAAQPKPCYPSNINDEVEKTSFGYMYIENNGNKFLEEIDYSIVQRNRSIPRIHSCITAGQRTNLSRARAAKVNIGNKTNWNDANGQMGGIPNVYIIDSQNKLVTNSFTASCNSAIQKMNSSDSTSLVATTADQNSNVPGKDPCGTADENNMTTDSDIVKLASFVSFENIFNHIKTSNEKSVDQFPVDSQSPQTALSPPASEDNSSTEVTEINNDVLEIDPCRTTISAVSIKDDASTECLNVSQTENISKRTRKRSNKSIMQGLGTKLANQKKAKKRKKIYTHKKKTPKETVKEILRICQSCGLQRPIDHKCSLSDPSCETGVGTRCDFCGGIKLEFHVCRRTELYPFKCMYCQSQFKHRHFYEKHVEKKHPGFEY